MREEQLTAFLYILMRDEVPPGVVARIIKRYLSEGSYIHTNKPLANMAEAYAKAILECKEISYE